MHVMCDMCGADCGHVARWSMLRCRDQLKVHHKETVSSSCISSLAITPDDAYAYLGCWDQQIVTFSVSASQQPGSRVYPRAHAVSWCVVSLACRADCSVVIDGCVPRAPVRWKSCASFSGCCATTMACRRWRWMKLAVHSCRARGTARSRQGDALNCQCHPLNVLW